MLSACCIALSQVLSCQVILTILLTAVLPAAWHAGMSCLAYHVKDVEQEWRFKSENFPK